MRIGELASQSATAVETIRYYEKQGLLPSPARNTNNYRAYNQQHLERMLFIRNGRRLGMSLNELRTLLQFRDSSIEGCERVNELLDQQIEQVSRRIEELSDLKIELESLRNRCAGGLSTSQCGILCELTRQSRAT